MNYCQCKILFKYFSFSEKEDLVNVLMRAVNNSSFHASSSAHSDVSSCTNSYPNSPHRSPFHDDLPNAKRKLSQSEENLTSQDGIRIRGTENADDDMNEAASVECSDSRTEEGAVGNAECSSNIPDNYSNDFINDSIQPFAEPISDSQEDNTAISDSVALPNENAQDEEPVPEILFKRPLMLSDINSTADLEALTVKQLKELLMRNRTDFKGCIERAELVEKANRLWSDYTISRKGNKILYIFI